MLIHDIIPVSDANGPGKRFVVWAQGCRRRCPGCFNPLTHARAGTPAGHFSFPAELSTTEILARIPADKVTGITVSGGEPFEQPEELRRLLAAARLLGFHTLVYSGYAYEELRRLFPACLRHIDILIDGPYLCDIPRTAPWAVSGNQRVFCLGEGKVIVWDTIFPGAPRGEVLIDKAGGITATGIFQLQE
ncbi:MAG: radical SAM protein [Spirochaetaceae bacterium]|nr:radical SAM protein [Spirochaetaceae bacterium]